MVNAFGRKTRKRQNEKSVSVMLNKNRWNTVQSLWDTFRA